MLYVDGFLPLPSCCRPEFMNPNRSEAVSITVAASLLWGVAHDAASLAWKVAGPQEYACPRGRNKVPIQMRRPNLSGRQSP